MENNIILQTVLSQVFEDEESSSSDEELQKTLVAVAVAARENIPRKHSFLKEINEMSDEEFQKHFRLSRTSYNYLFGRIEELIKSHNKYKENVDTHLQLLSSSWILSTPDSYRSIASRFDISKSTLFVCFDRVIKAINSIAESIIRWPTHEEQVIIEQCFYEMGQFHGCIGAIDGTYIATKAPQDHPETYINRKCFYGITLQAICDDKRKFLDTFCGYPSSVSDARIFRNSNIYRNIINNPNAYCHENNFIIGDKAYPLHEWCITPYIDRGNLQPHQINFNTHHAKARQVIERAFALLFGRFRRLKYLDMNRTDLIPFVVQAACVLHNICLMFNDNEDFEEEEHLFHQNPIEDQILNEVNVQHANIGARKRDQLAENFR